MRRSPRTSHTVLDAYAGGGMFVSPSVATPGVIAVEPDPLAVQDLLFNAAAAGSDHLVVEATVEEAIPEINDPWDIAVVDPPVTDSASRRLAKTSPRRNRGRSPTCRAIQRHWRDCRYLADVGYRLD